MALGEGVALSPLGAAPDTPSAPPVPSPMPHSEATMRMRMTIPPAIQMILREGCFGTSLLGAIAVFHLGLPLFNGLGRAQFRAEPLEPDDLH